MALFRRRKAQPEGPSRPSDDVLLAGYEKPKPWKLRLFHSLLYLIALVFLILVEIGNINNKAVIRESYFLKIDTSDILPTSIPDGVLFNSLAQTIGLRDFYQVGLWGYCEGYNGEGITYCSPPETLYWFNPIDIILSQLLAGATLTIPQEVIDILDIVKTASQWMFVCFLLGAILSFLCIFIAPMAFSQQPRWNHRGRRIFFRNLPITILSFLALLFTGVAAVLATVMFYIFTHVLNNQAAELNIKPDLGKRMLAFEWIAVACLLIGFVMQIGTCCGVCCCTGREKALRRSQMIKTEQ